MIMAFCIQSASEGVQLDQIQVISCLNKVCSCIQSGVVHPLVIDTDRTLHRNQMGNGILSKNRNSVAVDQIRDTMMDLRVNVVWTACKNNSSAAGTPIGKKEEPLQFDPGIFMDDDGKLYLYTGFALQGNPLLLDGSKPTEHSC